MDTAQRILRHVGLLLRARRAFLAFCFSLALLLGLRLLGRALGFPFPWLLALLVPLASLSAFLWPLSVRWVRVGKRLGLGGRLAGLVAALRSANPAFVGLLSPHVLIRPWRLFIPESFALLLVCFFAGLLVLPWERPQPGPALSPELFSGSAQAVPEPSLTGPEEAGPRPAPARAIPELPPGFSPPRSPYEELLAGLFGLEVPPEEVWARLAKEEGLLRRLAQLLREASAQGVTEEIRAEFAELVSELSRPDLRAALSSALGEQEEVLAEAQDIVAAALQGLDSLAEELSSSGAGAPGQAQRQEGAGTSRDQGLSGSPAAVPGEVLMDTEAGDRGEARLEEAEGGEELGAGWEPGQPGRPGLAGPTPQIEEIVSVPGRLGEGPVRQGFALGLPGETPGTAPESAPLPTVQEVELVLRAKDLPPGLRDVVRRYFQLLAEGGGS